MTDIERLDYTKPPPGYVVRYEDCSMANGDGPPLWWYGAPHYMASTSSEAEAVAAAWAHHKERHDPPGITVGRVHSPPTYAVWWAYYTGGGGLLCLFHRFSEADARAAAWARYDRRLALCGRLAAAGVDDVLFAVTERTSLWPRCLTWSDDHVAAVERWLDDPTVEMPEVLRS